ncbi:MAG: hypothetical protein AAF557_19615 [Pseudomonadota bacterium]
MYLRFVSPTRHPHCDAELGIYAAQKETDWTHQPDWLQREFDDAFQWFRYLSVPSVLKSRTRHKYAAQSLCWLKSDADWVLPEIRYAAWLLTEAGLPIREIKTRKPGAIIWEDEDQVVAIPGDTPIPKAF